jgi:hypothetical protein
MTEPGGTGTDVTGRTTTRRRRLRHNKIAGQFAPRLIEMLESPAYRVLSGPAHRILSRLEIEHGHHGGHENGRLPVSGPATLRRRGTTGSWRGVWSAEAIVDPRLPAPTQKRPADAFAAGGRFFLGTATFPKQSWERMAVVPHCFSVRGHPPMNPHPQPAARKPSFLRGLFFFHGLLRDG